MAALRNLDDEGRYPTREDMLAPFRGFLIGSGLGLLVWVVLAVIFYTGWHV